MKRKIAYYLACLVMFATGMFVGITPAHATDQTLTPDLDLSAGNPAWTKCNGCASDAGKTLTNQVDDASPGSDTDFITGSTGMFDLRLSDASSPGVNTGHVLHVRIKTGSQVNFTLVQGSMAVSDTATATGNGGSNYQAFDLTLNITATPGIGDYNDLHLQGYASGSTKISFISLTIPPAANPDQTPPAVPSDFAGSPGNASATLSWTANTEEDLDYYTVAQSTTLNGTYTDVATPDSIVNSTTITGLTNGVDYFFKLAATDFSGNKSSYTTAIGPITPVSSGPILWGYVGCSNTYYSVLGYLQLPSPGTKMWANPSQQYFNGTVRAWELGINTPSNQYWNRFNIQLNANPSTDAVWFELCQAATDTYPVSAQDSAENVIDEIIDQFSSTNCPNCTDRSPDIFISAINGYASPHVCNTLGSSGRSEMVSLQSALVNASDGVNGPDMDTLVSWEQNGGANNSTGSSNATDQTLADGCHPNAKNGNGQGKEGTILKTAWGG